MKVGKKAYCPKFTPLSPRVITTPYGGNQYAPVWLQCMETSLHLWRGSTGRET